MNIKPEEISSIIQQEISEFKIELDVEEVGTVIHVGDGVARVYGLLNCVYSELVEFPNGVFGMALNLEDDSVGCILLVPIHLYERVIRLKEPGVSCRFRLGRIY